MKTHNIYFTLSGVCLVILLWLFSIGYKDQPGHECKWPLCPYKGVKPSGYEKAVIAYGVVEGSDSYCIDLLHLEYPTLEYEALEELLFNPSGLQVIDTIRDNRGLISVKFIQGGKKYALDYLTQHEYDSLINQ